MMASYCKELLRDLVYNRLDIDTRVTLTHAIEQLYKSGVFTRSDIVLLHDYLCGYDANELALMYFLSTETVTDILARLCVAIEHASGNLDEHMLQKWAAKYTAKQLQHAKTYMERSSKEFTYESL